MLIAQMILLIFSISEKLDSGELESRDKGHRLRLVGILQIDLEIITLSRLRDAAVIASLL